MEKQYTINEVAVMSGLTTRTLRNYIKMGILKGELADGVWKFSEEDIEEFFKNPYVKPSIQAKNKAIVFDFLAQNEKRINEICTILDVCVEKHEAEEIAAFFCEEVSKRTTGNLKFSFERNGSHARVILKGYEDVVMEVLNLYYQLG